MASSWLSVYQRELNMRRRVAAEDPNYYRRISSVNPKGLLLEHQCPQHVWVPATHLMIHNQGGKTHTIGGIPRRGLNEAKPYKDSENLYIPQICWDCDSYRIKELSVLSTQERNKQFAANRPRKRRGRTPTGEVQSIIDDWFT